MRLVGRDAELGLLRSAVNGDGPRAVVVAGRAGVGKSRLLRELCDELSDRWHIEYVVAAPGVGQVPFGAISHLLPTEAAEAPAQLLTAARARLRSRAEKRPLLVAVDDAHELDDGSAALVHQMIVHREARAVLTVRTTAAPPASITSLWKDGHATRVDVPPLPEGDTLALAAEVLGGPLSPDLGRTVWTQTKGHPLYVVEALRSAREDGTIVSEDGVWTATGPLTSSRLHDVVTHRLGSLAAADRRGLETVAVAQPLPLRHLARILADAVIDRLHEQGLVEIGQHPEAIVSTAHPLFAEVVVGAMGHNRLKEIAGQLVDAVTADVEIDAGMRLRAALWMLDSERPPDSRLAVAGAQEAMRRIDYPLAERLAQVASNAEPDLVPAAVVLARALAFQGSGEEAIRVLDGCSTERPEEVVPLALTRGHILAFLLGRPQDGARVLQVEAQGLPDQHRWQLDSERALYSAIAGDFAATFDAATAALDNPDTPEATTVTAHVNLSLAMAMTGRLADFDTVVDEGERLARRHEAELPLAADQLGLSRASAWATAGRITDAERLCRRRVEHSTESGAPNPLWLAWHGLALGMQGSLLDAVSTQAQAMAAYEAADPFRLRPQSVGIWLMHAAQTGDAPADAPQQIDDAALAAGGETRLAVWLGRARAWLTALDDPDTGAGIAREVGCSAIEHDHLVWGAWALHDAARMGRAHTVVDDLAAGVAATQGAALLETMLGQARAMSDGDAEHLEEVARQMERHGSPMYAAEALAEAARIWWETDQDVLGARATFRSSALLRRCQSVATPAVVGMRPALTERELEVALAAADGSTSREVGDALFVSVRTVDNHLRSVYRKLGLPGREALTDLVQDVTADLE